MSTNAYEGSTDGLSPSQFVVVTMQGKVKGLGFAAPVAELSRDKVLCAAAGPNTELVRPTILSLGGSRARRYSKRGTELGWDGKHVLLAHTQRVDVIDPISLRKFKTMRVPELERLDWSSWTPFVGIPT